MTLTKELVLGIVAWFVHVSILVFFLLNSFLFPFPTMVSFFCSYMKKLNFSQFSESQYKSLGCLFVC